MPKPPKHPAPAVRARHVETMGLVLIVILILIIMLVRFGRTASWSWR